MNFLAHAVLSFNEPEVLFGQMISDFVKGRRQFDFPPGIQRGIRLHRQIDEFTDQHPAIKQAKELFSQIYRLYSGAFIDVSFDYFLARDPAEFNPERLFSFSREVYDSLETYKAEMPPVFAGIFAYMKRDNWLFGYSQEEGIYQSFRGLVHRAKYMHDADPAIKLFSAHKSLLQEHYAVFWPDLKNFASGLFRESS